MVEGLFYEHTDKPQNLQKIIENLEKESGRKLKRIEIDIAFEEE